MPLRQALYKNRGMTCPRTETALTSSIEAIDSSVCILDARKLTLKLSSYRSSYPARSVVEILVTAVPLLLLWVLMWTCLKFGLFWVYVVLALPAAGFLVRLFMIQHDCGHGAFFPTRKANDWIGRIIGVFTLTPYDHWRR